ncbi:MAG: hypothetical protein K6U74_08510 [Firmicutes bacterium]|nr:hypothetical protein [Bacillota bacterium]
MDGWLLLIYKIPSEPTRYRAAIWRKIKAMGAVYLQNSACVLPVNLKSERQFRQLRREIESYGGEGYLIKGVFLGNEQQVVDMFNRARDEEYEEIIDRCRDFFKEIDKEIERKHFTYAELEENEEDLEKLKKWFDKVKERDFFNAGKMASTAEILEKCQEKLDEFGSYVFASEDFMEEAAEVQDGK